VSFEAAYDRREFDGFGACAEEREHVAARRGLGTPRSEQSQPVEPGYCRCAATHDWGTFARGVFQNLKDSGLWSLDFNEDGNPSDYKVKRIKAARFPLISRFLHAREKNLKQSLETNYKRSEISGRREPPAGNATGGKELDCESNLKILGQTDGF
jgi:hypothetical protein